MPNAHTGSNEVSEIMGQFILPPRWQKHVNEHPISRISHTSKGDLTVDPLRKGETEESRERLLDQLYDVYSALQSGRSVYYNTKSDLYQYLKSSLGSNWDQHPITLDVSQGERDWFEQRDFENQMILREAEEKVNGPAKGKEEIIEPAFSPGLFQKAVDSGLELIKQSRGFKETPGTYYSTTFPFKKIDNPADIKKYYKLNKAAPVPMIYKNFADKFDETLDANCLKSVLLERYNKNIPQKKAISAKTIQAIDDTSIESLENFCQKYKIPYKFYTITGNLISKAKFPKTSNRVKLSAILYAGHIYPWTGSARKISFERINALPAEVIEVPKKIKINPDEFKINPNFTYKSEEQSICKALSYEIDSQCSATEDGKNTYKVDLKRAYYQLFFHTYVKEQIAVFIAEDIIRPFTSDVKLVPHWEYYLNEAPKYFTTNKVLGRTLIELLVQNRVKLENVKFYKSSFYTIPVERICKIYKEAGMTDVENFRQFSVLSGMLGARVVKTKVVNADLVYELDTQLVEQYADERGTCNVASRAVTMDINGGARQQYINYTKPGSYKYINCSNIYDAIVDFCCLYTLCTIDKLEKQGCIIQSVKTDSIQFLTTNTTCPIPVSPKGSYNDGFMYSPETPANTQLANLNIDFINCASIISNIADEQSKIQMQLRILDLPAGQGKTYYIARNEKYDYVMTVSNILAAKLSADITLINPKISASTLHRGLNILTGQTKMPIGTTVWIDEFSLVQRYIWSTIFMMAANGIKFIISGDHNQISPVGENSITESILWPLISSNKIELLKHGFCRNDQKIVDLSLSILNDAPEKWINGLNYVSEEKYLEFYFHLSGTNRVRNLINNAIMAKRNLTIDFEKQTVSSGLVIKAICAIENIAKGSRFVTFGNKDGVIICRLKDPNTILPEGLEAPITITWDCFIRHFEVSFCMTASGSQGLTVLDSICIHETSHIYNWDKKILYTALTRGKEYQKLNFSNAEPDDTIFKITDILDDYRLSKKISNGKLQQAISVAE